MRHNEKLEHPPWLKAMHNGALAEARTKAFLLDRFWVLERSADIDGADFIIQRRLTNRNLLDSEAPRLGVVQSKFFGSPATHHTVHKQYVLDDDGNPRKEFFLMCHTGDAKSRRAFIASGSDVANHFPLCTENGQEKFAISYKLLTAGGRFEICDAGRALDRIERQLQLAEFRRNREFLSWALPSAASDLEAIKPAYHEPIGNSWGDIPSAFAALKRKAQTAMLDVHDVYKLLLRVTEATDPLEAWGFIEEIELECRDGRGRLSIHLPDDLNDEELFLVCRRHMNMVSKLQDDGLLDAFLSAEETLRVKVTEALEGRLPFAASVVHRFTVVYDPQRLVIDRIESTFEEFVEDHDKATRLDLWGRDVTKSGPGRIECRWLPGRACSRSDEGLSLTEALGGREFHVYYDCMEAMFENKYGEANGT